MSYESCVRVQDLTAPLALDAAATRMVKELKGCVSRSVRVLLYVCSDRSG